MNLENMTIEQLKAMAFDAMLAIQQQQYNLQVLTAEINKKQGELNKQKVASITKPKNEETE